MSITNTNIIPRGRFTILTLLKTGNSLLLNKSTDFTSKNNILMQSPENISSQSVDKSQIPPLHQKRIIAFINHFLISSCQFLNEFSTKCEFKLLEVERKMQKLEANLLILEAKLDSIPNFEDEKPQNTTPPNTQTTCQETKENPSAESSPKDEKGVLACNDTRYRKYFKMLQFGVPPEAVKLKMRQEGVDNPEIISTPNLILNDGIEFEEPVM